MPSDTGAAQPPTSADDAVRQIDRIVAAAEQPLLELSESFTRLYDEFFDATGTDTKRLAALTEALEPQCLGVLDEPSPRLIEGLGFVWVAPEGSSGMVWWRAEHGTIARKQHVFNPESDSYYDYRNSVWFLGANAASGLTIVGPYIDSWGTDDHTLTASMQMLMPHGPVGVSAADLNVSTLTSQIESVLSGLPGSVLVSDEDRVVASNIALLTPGLRLQPYLNRSGAEIVERRSTTLDAWELVELS